LILIILGVLVVGIAIAVGLLIFKEHAISSKREVVTNECVNLASDAITYFKRTKSYGGGGRSFVGWSVPGSLSSTASGTYQATVYSDSVVIIGTGNEIVTGNDSVKVKVTATGDSYKVQTIN
jgi:hypothetical protein